MSAAQFRMYDRLLQAAAAEAARTLDDAADFAGAVRLSPLSDRSGQQRFSLSPPRSPATSPMQKRRLNVSPPRAVAATTTTTRLVLESRDALAASVRRFCATNGGHHHNLHDDANAPSVRLRYGDVGPLLEHFSLPAGTDACDDAWFALVDAMTEKRRVEAIAAGMLMASPPGTADETTRHRGGGGGANASPTRTSAAAAPPPPAYITDADVIADVLASLGATVPAPLIDENDDGARGAGAVGLLPPWSKDATLQRIMSPTLSSRLRSFRKEPPASSSSTPRQQHQPSHATAPSNNKTIARLATPLARHRHDAPRGPVVPRDETPEALAQCTFSPRITVKGRGTAGRAQAAAAAASGTPTSSPTKQKQHNESVSSGGGGGGGHGFLRPTKSVLARYFAAPPEQRRAMEEEAALAAAAQSAARAPRRRDPPPLPTEVPPGFVEAVARLRRSSSRALFHETLRGGGSSSSAAAAGATSTTPGRSARRSTTPTSRGGGGGGATPRRQNGRASVATPQRGAKAVLRLPTPSLERHVDVYLYEY